MDITTYLQDKCYVRLTLRSGMVIEGKIENIKDNKVVIDELFALEGIISVFLDDIVEAYGK